ncbi:WD40-repeat-containing domain protein [Pisolithus croceorrhizus]|nr:WD40-repeat-containing domain protein [Pisolithus croceorrhizus]
MSLSLQPFCAKEDDLRGHSESITCLSFSPTGDYLASGGEDGNLIVWDPMKGTLVHRVPVNGTITSMAWDPDDIKRRIFVGTARGTIFAINDFSVWQDQDSDILTGVDAPVYAIAIDTYSGVIALGMGSEVHLAKWVSPSHYATFKILPPPPELPNTLPDTDKHVRVRALAFTEGGDHLLATYLSHGIVCWDLVHPQSQFLWTIVPMHSHRLIGHCLLSLDEQTVLISNLSEGMDLYRIRHCHPYRRFKYTADTGDNLPVQVAFLHDGRVVACGSMDGNVTVWDVANEDQIQVLPHDVRPPLLTVVQAYQYRDFTLLATGTSHSSENTYIRIWCSDTSRSAFSLSTDSSHFVLFLLSKGHLAL